MLNYDNLLREALAAVPEFKKEYDSLIEEDIIDNEAGMHIVFGYAFCPVLEEAIHNKNEKVIRACFDFMEKMCSSPDDDVVAVCDQSITERLNDEFDEKTLRPLMGKNTEEGYNAIKRFFR